MQQVPKQAVRALFDRIGRGTGFFGEFRAALQHVQDDEHPYMWLMSQVRGTADARILLTDRRMLVFCVRLVAKQCLSLTHDVDLDMVVGSPLLKKTGKHASLGISFGNCEANCVSFQHLPGVLAEKVKRFVGLSKMHRIHIALLAAEGNWSPLPVREADGRESRQQSFEWLWQEVQEPLLWIRDEEFSVPSLGQKHRSRKGGISPAAILVGVVVFFVHAVLVSVGLAGAIAYDVCIILVDIALLKRGYRRFGSEYVWAWAAAVAIQLVLLGVGWRFSSYFSWGVGGLAVLRLRAIQISCGG